MNAILRGILPGEGRVAGIVSPSQDAGIFDVLGQELGIFQPAHLVLSRRPGPADPAAQAMDGHDAAVVEIMSALTLGMEARKRESRPLLYLCLLPVGRPVQLLNTIHGLDVHGGGWGSE